MTMTPEELEFWNRAKNKSARKNTNYDRTRKHKFPNDGGKHLHYFTPIYIPESLASKFGLSGNGMDGKPMTSPLPFEQFIHRKIGFIGESKYPEMFPEANVVDIPCIGKTNGCRVCAKAQKMKGMAATAKMEGNEKIAKQYEMWSNKKATEQTVFNAVTQVFNKDKSEWELFFEYWMMSKWYWNKSVVDEVILPREVDIEDFLMEHADDVQSMTEAEAEMYYLDNCKPLNPHFPWHHYHGFQIRLTQTGKAYSKEQLEFHAVKRPIPFPYLPIPRKDGMSEKMLELVAKSESNFNFIKQAIEENRFKDLSEFRDITLEEQDRRLGFTVEAEPTVEDSVETQGNKVDGERASVDLDSFSDDGGSEVDSAEMPEFDFESPEEPDSEPEAEVKTTEAIDEIADLDTLDLDSLSLDGDIPF